VVQHAGNLLSILAFFIWIPIAIYGARRWPPAKATAALYLGGLLLLPELVAFKLPAIPEFGKEHIIVTWVFIGALLFHRDRLKAAPSSWQFRLSVGLLLVGAIFTILLNPDPFTVGSVYISGHVPYDAVHGIVNVLLQLIVPFYLGAAMFRNGSDLRVLFKVLVTAALLYSLLQLVELRLSPQMHNWVYGFSQHVFAQTMRAGGFRPMVFMEHGLALALFTALAVFGAAALHKSKAKVFRFPAIWAMGYLWAILLFSKSIAAFLYSLIAVPMIFFASPRAQTLTALALGIVLLAYPAARYSGLIPVDDIRAFVMEQYGPEKVESIMTRFENEEEMLERAVKRPWFGWGSYCRVCLFEPWTGKMISVRDGDWLIQLGDYGIVGFLGKFGLLIFPLFVLARRLRYVPRESDRRLLAALGLMVGFSAFDMIPNGNYNALAFVLSGALFGCVTGALQEAAQMRRKKRLARSQAHPPAQPKGR